MKTKERITTLLTWIGLFLFAIILLGLFVPICFLVGLFQRFYKKKIGTGLDEFTNNLSNVTYTLDLLGNVTLFEWTWWWWKKSEGYKFGQRNQTISEVLHCNYNNNTLTNRGRKLYNIINKVDPGHFEIF